MSTLKRYTDKSKETRSYIAEALIKLMQKHSLDNVKVSQITKTAGISRMTYYLYYESKIDVLYDYIHEISRDYQMELSSSPLTDRSFTYNNILYCFRYFKKYSYIALTLEKQNLYYIFQNALNNYMEQYLIPNYSGNPLKLYGYSGALANLYLKWIRDGFIKSDEEMADLVYNMFFHEL